LSWNSQREFERTSNDHFRSFRTRHFRPSVSGEGTVDYQSTDAAFEQKFWGSFGESDTRSVQQGSTWRVPETTHTRSGQYGSGAANPLTRSSSGGHALDSGFYDAGFASWGYEGQAIHTRFDSAIGPGSPQSPSTWDDSTRPDMESGPNLLRQLQDDGGRGDVNYIDDTVGVMVRVPQNIEAASDELYSRVEYENRITAFSGITALNWSDGGEFLWNAFSWENVSGAAKATITAPFKIVEQSVLMAFDGLLYVANGGYLPRAYSELGDALRTGQITGAQAAWEMGTFIFTLGIKQQYDAASHYWNGDLSDQDYRDQVAGNLWGVYLGGRALSVAPRAATSLASGSIPMFATVVTADGALAVAQAGALTVSPAIAGAFAGAGTSGLIVLMAAGNIPDGELPKSNAPRNAGYFTNSFDDVADLGRQAVSYRQRLTAVATWLGLATNRIPKANVAVVEYLDELGNLQTVTRISGRIGHAEKRAIDVIRQRLGDNFSKDSITRIYSDLSPCKAGGCTSLIKSVTSPNLKIGWLTDVFSKKKGSTWPF